MQYFVISCYYKLFIFTSPLRRNRIGKSTINTFFFQFLLLYKHCVLNCEIILIYINFCIMPQHINSVIFTLYFFFQFHVVFCAQQSRQRETSVKTLRSLIPAVFKRLACWVAELNTALSNVSRARKWKCYALPCLVMLHRHNGWPHDWPLSILASWRLWFFFGPIPVC